jgi:nucleoside permease NupC
MFSPIAWLLGIPWENAVTGGSFIGQKLVVNEFVAFVEFGSSKRPSALALRQSSPLHSADLPISLRSRFY